MTAAATTQQATKQAQIPIKAPARKKAKKKAKKKASTALAVHKPQPPAAPKSLLQVISEASRDPAVDVGKMRELLAMAREEEALRAEVTFNNALADAKEKIPVIVKDGKGDRAITYAKLETVSRAIDPILKANGFTLSFGMADSPKIDHYRITAELRHRAGYKKEYFADIPPSITGPKGAPIMTVTQGAGSAISFARRYLKLMIFDITIVGEDDNGTDHAPVAINADELLKLKNAIKFADADVARFCEHFCIEAIEQLPKRRLEEAMRLLAQKAGQ